MTVFFKFFILPAFAVCAVEFSKEQPVSVIPCSLIALGVSVVIEAIEKKYPS